MGSGEGSGGEAFGVAKGGEGARTGSAER